jgi:hypothetical protein
MGFGILKVITIKNTFFQDMEPYNLEDHCYRFGGFRSNYVLVLSFGFHELDSPACSIPERICK